MLKRLDAKSWRRTPLPGSERPGTESPDDWYDLLPKSGGHGNAAVRIRSPEPVELAFISWGLRKFDEPIVPSRHEGWHYFMVLSGSPSLMVEGRRRSTQPGTFTLGHPDTLIGHADHPGRACRILTWIWRTPPAHSALLARPDEPLVLQLSGPEIARMKRLHTECRDTVVETGERAEVQLRSLRLQIDLCLLDATERVALADDGLRFDRAMRYLREHLADRNCLVGMHKRLHISKARLNALFWERAGKPPRTVVHDLRLQWAREQLVAARMSVKAVSFALGYRHPPDFSRAFKQHFQVAPSEVLTVK